MNMIELRKLSPEDLKQKLLEIRLNQLSMRVRKSSGNLAGTHEISRSRKTIARIKTLLTQLNGSNHG